MTTPVAPAAMSVRVGRRHLHIWVRRPQDPFVLAARVYVHRGTGPFDLGSARVVCTTRTFRCRKRLSRRPIGPVTFAAVSVDPWTTSPPVFSKPVTLYEETRWSTARASHVFACALQTLCSWPPG